MTVDLLLESASPLLPPPKPSHQPSIRALRPRDHEPLKAVLLADGLFTAEERSVALELIEGALAEPGGEYRVLVAELAERVVGYVCYGPTPMTEGTWDLYWIATHPDARGHGVARRLTEHMEAELRGLGARLVRVETSQLDSYGAAHAFYERLQYPVVARIPDFYKPGDDLVVMAKRL
jgi:ribosomal protein S18 acetylase RimI-like enzyme